MSVRYDALVGVCLVEGPCGGLRRLCGGSRGLWGFEGVVWGWKIYQKKRKIWSEEVRNIFTYFILTNFFMIGLFHSLFFL